MSKIGRVAPLVGQASIVEDLQEQVPDRDVGLFEFVEKNDGKRLLTNLVDEGGARRMRVVVPQNAAGGAGGVELAHVQANHLVLRAEQELRQRLGDLRFPRPCRTGKQENSLRTARIGQSGLDHRDSLDETLDRFRLTEDSLVESLT